MKNHNQKDYVSSCQNHMGLFWRRMDLKGIVYLVRGLKSMRREMN